MLEILQYALEGGFWRFLGFLVIIETPIIGIILIAKMIRDTYE